MPSRLGWLTLHLGLIALGVVALARGWGGWLAAPLWSLVIGHSFAGCAFVAHEALHGAVVRGGRARLVVGWLGFLPFTLSPRLWVAWHNRTHHGHTMQEGVDPDAYPTLTAWRESRLTRFADRLSFGRGRPLGVLVTLAIGLTGQSTQMLWRWSRTAPALPPRERRLAIAEALAGMAVWALVAWQLGAARFVFAYVLPLFVGNAIVMAYILTNHSLSPLTDVNDPLLNTLTVTTPRLVSWLHLDFGLHVEHHLFPALSSKYAPLVRAELVARWPERYQSLPLGRALARLLATPRVYASPTRLVDPHTGVEAETLAPRAEGTRAPAIPTATEPEAVPPLTGALEPG